MSKSTLKSKETQIAAYERIQRGEYTGKSIPVGVLRQATRGKELIDAGFTVKAKPVKVVVPAVIAPAIKQQKIPPPAKSSNKKTSDVSIKDNSGKKTDYKRNERTHTNFTGETVRGAQKPAKNGYIEVILRSLIDIYRNGGWIGDMWITDTDSSDNLSLRTLIKNVSDKRDQDIIELNATHDSVVYVLNHSDLTIQRNKEK